MMDVRELAERIASGHAYRRHVVQRREFPEVAGVEQFAEPIADVILNPDAQKSLPGERHTYWQERSRTVVLLNPNDSDGGTAIRPESERSYLDRA